MKKIFFSIITLIMLSLPVFSKDTINVAYTIDDNYPIFTLLSINSILKNNYSNSDYNFFIIENNLSDKHKKLMKNYVEKRNQKINFININTNFIDNGDKIWQFLPHITEIAIARIILPNIIPQNIDKILYLDGDTLVTTDLKELYDINLHNYYVGMITNISNQKYDGITKNNSNYYNSGVMLMNVKQWRKDNISEKLLNFLNSNKKRFIYNEDEEIDNNCFQTNTWYFMIPDQDLINIVLDDKIKTLPAKFNQQYCCFDYLGYNKIFFKKGIYHYISRVKPWFFPIKKIEAVQIYYDYWSKSGLNRYKYYYLLKNIYEQFITSLQIRFDNIKSLLLEQQQVYSQDNKSLKENFFKNFIDIFMFSFPLWLTCFFLLYSLSSIFKILHNYNYLFAALLTISQFAIFCYSSKVVILNFHEENSLSDIYLSDPYFLALCFNILLILFIAQKKAIKFYIIPCLFLLLFHFWFVLYA